MKRMFSDFVLISFLSMIEFDYVKVPNGFHLFSKSDLCTYSKNGCDKDKEGNLIQYYKCTQKECKVKGRVVKDSFSLTSSSSDKHNHPNQEEKVATVKAYEEIKQKVSAGSRISSRKVYVDVMKS